MNLDQLKTFCSTDETRPSITHPFTVGAFSFATDGRILIRVPALVEVPEYPESTKTAKNVIPILDQDQFNDYKPLPPFEPREKDPCPACCGEGKVNQIKCDCCNEEIWLNGQVIRCLDCGGVGRKLKLDEKRGGFADVDVSGVQISVKYYEMIMSLPWLTIATNKAQDGPLRFKFDGGDGLLMPVRLT